MGRSFDKSYLAWGLAALVSIVAFIAWGDSNSWTSHPSTYQIFPLLGLWAFGLMWAHYVVGSLRGPLDISGDSLKPYYRYTGYAVLALICLHPGLLVYQLFRDGAGLPPGSYEHYVRPGLGWVTLLGTVSLLIFLAFEFHRVFGKKPWWHYVVDLSDAAMLAIVYHGLRLGSQLQMGWYKYVWYVYALALVIVLANKYIERFSSKQKARP
jgi:hypothetical protein